MRLRELSKTVDTCRRFCIRATSVAILNAAGLVGGDTQARDYENLQVLPQDITASELFANMKRLTIALGVYCNSCHRNDVRDYASDEIVMKQKARDMMRMVEQMNAGLPADATDDAKVTCFTCHRGKLKPTQVEQSTKQQPDTSATAEADGN